jgi:hypothetical protein
MYFPWDKLLPKVILLRLKRHGKRTESTLIATSDVGSASVPPGITSVPALSTSTEMGPEVSTTELHWRQASDIAQLSLPVLQATAGAVPIVGASIQAAISGLLAILQAIDVSSTECKYYLDSAIMAERHPEQGRPRTVDITALRITLPFVERATCPTSS